MPRPVSDASACGRVRPLPPRPARARDVRRLRLALVVAFVIASCSLGGQPASADALDKLVIGASAADLVTSEIALSRPGTAEANPLGPSTAARVALKVAGTAAILAVSRKVNHKTGRILKVVAFLAWSGAAVHNMTVRR
jgi:hypothetical protein